MRTLLIVAALLLAVAPRAQAQQETLLCVGELSTGFRWSGTAWERATFNVDADRFVVSPSGEGGAYSITRIGEARPSHECTRYASDGFVSSRLVCGGLGYGMSVDFQHLRYQEFYGMGYIDGNDEGGNTPNITIGKCSVIPR